MTKDGALDLALEVMQINLKLLEKINPYKGQEDLLSDSINLTHEAITAIKQARSAPVQEPLITDEKGRPMTFWGGKATPPAAPVQETEVSWGVDWGRVGDKSCAMIIKRLPDGKIEVVAVEYEP
jgi:hypothetical protein